MRKMKLWVAGAVLVATVAGVCLSKVGAKAEETVITEVGNTDCFNDEEVDVERFDRLLPVIASLGGHVHTRNSGYHAYKSSFYETSINGILKYCENDKLVEYTEDDNNYYLDKMNMQILSDIAYWGGDCEKLYYDENTELYVIKKNDVDLGYEVKLNKAIESECEHGMNYTLKGELYKDGEKIDDISVDILENENDNSDMPYSVHWLWLDNYGIEVY